MEVKMGRKFRLDRFDDAKLEATRLSWASTVEDLGLFPPEYDKTISWVESHIQYDVKNGDSFAYGIFQSDKEDAVAVVDIVHSNRVRDAGLIKMLQVTMGPALAPSRITTESYAELLAIYSEAVVGTIALTAEHSARIVKLYGRDDDLMKLFAALNVQLNLQTGAPLKSKLEGRWLVISSN
jgi:hypothetical protein